MNRLWTQVGEPTEDVKVEETHPALPLYSSRRGNGVKDRTVAAWRGNRLSSGCETHGRRIGLLAPS